ncbi:MAG: sigma 54-interacting transcriptional regulator, partial [Gammaproteobacteria bacterium]
EMPGELQAKLLRVLETGRFMRVGANEFQETDVRVLAATNRLPEQAVAEGKLREDLLYRLQVFPLYVPPLRERVEDIELLAIHFLAEMNRAESTNKTLAAQELALLRNYHWPGNVRELKNALHRAFIMADDLITMDLLPQELSTAHPSTDTSSDIGVGLKIEEAERRLVLATLEHCGNNKEKTATMLGMSVKTLYNRLRKYGMQ